METPKRQARRPARSVERLLKTVDFLARFGISVFKKFVMEESQPPSIPETPPPPSTSLFSRLTNVFVAPADVFDEIKSSKPTTANWIVPLVLAMIAGVIYTLVVFSQPAVIQKM